MKLTLRDVFNAVFRYSHALLIFWAAAVIAVLVFYTQTMKLYDSKAKILISLGTEALGKADYVNGKNLLLTQREQQIHNEEQILQSHEVMLTVAKWVMGDPTPGWRAPVNDAQMEEAKRFVLNEDPAPTLLLSVKKSVAELFDRLFERPETHDERLESIVKQFSDDLGAKAVFDSDALDVTFRYRNPNVAQTILGLVIDAYLQHHISVFQNSAEADLLNAELKRSVNSYHDRLSQFSSFMNTHQVYNDDSQVNVLIDQREKLKQSLNEALADSEAAAARLASLSGIQDSLRQLEHYSTTEVRNRERDALLAKLNDAALEEKTLLTRHPEGSRAYQDEQAKLQELRQLIGQEPEQVIQETEHRKSKAAEFVESEVISVNEIQRGDLARISRLRTDLRAIDSEINKYATDLKGFDALKLDLAFAKQESEQMAQVYVGSRLKSLTSQNAITDISVIDAPTLNPTPASPNGKVVLAAVILLFVVGTFAVLFACIGFDTTLADSGTAELRLGLPVIGTIPVTRPQGNANYFPDLFTQANEGEFARIYQLLRDREPRGKIILITESKSKEGASLVGYGLSRFLGRYACQKTAFIDRTDHPVTNVSDVRVNAEDEQTVLAWSGAESSATSRIGSQADVSSLSLAWPNPSADGEADVAALLVKLRQEFAFVVIAVGAVKDAADLLAISGIVSAVFFILEAGKTRAAAARYNLSLLQRYGFQNIRLILNKRIFYIPAWLMRFV